MKTIKLIVGFIVAIASATAWGNQGLMVTWDRALACPPEWSASEIALAEVEVLPENWNKTKVAYASDYGQKLEEKSDEPTPYFEVSGTTRRGNDPANSFGSIGFYGELPIGGDGWALWLSGSQDPAFRGSYIGFAKKFGNWQLGLGTGSVHYGEQNRSVQNPWVYYSSDEYEALAHAEHYGKEYEDNPWWHKAYIEKKVGDWGFGLYGESGMGTGPRVSYKITPNLKVWVTVPIWKQPETDARMQFLAGFILSF